jgi:hypothetical protein
MLVGDDAGEGHLPTAQREFSPSITPSSRAVAGEEEPSRRQLNDAHSGQSAERSSIAPGGHASNEASRNFVVVGRRLFLASNGEIASNEAHRCSAGAAAHEPARVRARQRL